MYLLTLVVAIVISCIDPCISQIDSDSCLVVNTDGCSLGRAPRYLIVAPKSVRPGQTVQLFITILRLEYGNEPLDVQASLLRDKVECITQATRFDRPSSRVIQLLIPPNAPPGQYSLQVQGRLAKNSSGYVFTNETSLQFNTKSVSIFIQMSRPIYRQHQMVHFRIIPVKPDLMPYYDTATIYIEDSTGFSVRRWQAIQSNAGGIISLSFQLADQPNFGTWHIKVEAFGHVYRHPFIVEEFWEPRFDVNVTTNSYVMVDELDNDEELPIKGVMMANHTSGRACMGNASATAFFRPSEEQWNMTEGWLKPYRDSRDYRLDNMEIPEYRPLSDIPVKDYYLYFPYEYRFIDYFHGRYDFEWTSKEIKTIAKRGQYNSIVNGEVVFFMNVTDWYSGYNRTGWSGTFIVSNAVKMTWIGGAVRSFKPGSKMDIQLAVARSDGTPVADGGLVEISVNIDGDDSNSQTQFVQRGLVEFELFLGMSAKMFSIQAAYMGSDTQDEDVISSIPEAHAPEMRGIKYYSPTNSYISVSTSTKHPNVNEYMIFHVFTSQYIPRIFYQIIAKGNIVDGDELEMNSRQKTFSIALSRDMAPTARIMVYYIRLPREIVSDVLSFFVNGTSHNQVRISANCGKDFSRDTIEFNAYAYPGSFLATSGVLLDFYQRGLNDGITENKLIDELMSYDAVANGSYRHLWRLSGTDYEYVFFHGTDYGMDTNSTIKNAGLVVMTDIDISQLPNVETCDVTAGFYPCFSGIEEHCFTSEQRCNGVYDGCPNDGADEWGCEDDTLPTDMTNPISRVSRVMRFYDNSSWAWQEIFVKPDGRVDYRVGVPKYPLSWMINAISISRDMGLGIMPRPLRYDTMRYMYIQVEHPEEIVMGEIIGVRITVFNYWFQDDYIEVIVTFHAGQDTSIVVVDEFGITSSYAPKTHKGDQQTIVFLEPGESKDIYMPIIPDRDLDLANGEVNFYVSASCFMEKDEYFGAMRVQPNGVLNYYHTPYMIDLITQPSVQVPDLQVNVLEEFRKSDIRYNMYVPGSASAMTTFFGDVMVPGFFEDYLNAENLLHRPYGGGEMVTFNFAYNLLSLRFMRHSNQLEDSTLTKSLVQMRIALQRVFTYMHVEDELVSFKMFRDDPRPNLWLTAFVGKTLSQAILGERWEQELYIPENLISQLIDYICSRQSSDGAFYPLHDEGVFDRKMASLKNSSTNVMYNHEIPLTAYVLIALSKMTTNAQNSMGCLEKTKREASLFLASKANYITKKEVFFMAITTYALSLTDVNTAQFERKLMAMQINGSYFADGIVYPNPRQPQQNIWYDLPRQELMNEAYALQSTAYALMALMRNDLMPKKNRDTTMAWMNTLRNSVGGFASTQDTIVALEALFEYTNKDPNRKEFRLTVNVNATSTSDWGQEMVLDKSHYVQMKKACLPRKAVWGYIVSTAEGVGRGMLQLTTTVRVEEPFLLKTQMHYDNDKKKDLIKFFDIDVQTIRFPGRNASIMEMTNCVSWVFTEKSLTSGLSVLEVDIPTGYVTMNDSLRDYVQSSIVPNLKRAESYGRKVVFYFDRLDTSKTCVYFRADRWYPVSNSTQEYRIRVYDYYEPGMHQTQMYKTRSLNRLNICYVCGSYQCPYCPYFNAADVTKAGFVITWFCLLVYYVVKSSIHRDGGT